MRTTRTDRKDRSIGIGLPGVEAKRMGVRSPWQMSSWLVVTAVAVGWAGIACGAGSDDPFADSKDTKEAAKSVPATDATPGRTTQTAASNDPLAGPQNTNGAGKGTSAAPQTYQTNPNAATTNPPSTTTAKASQPSPNPGPTSSAAQPVFTPAGQFGMTLDQALAAAMEKNPGVITAKAKVQLAEAELNAARSEVAREIFELWTARQACEDRVKVAKANLEEETSAELKKVARMVLVKATMDLAGADSQLLYLTGRGTNAFTRGPTDSDPVARDSSPTASTPYPGNASHASDAKRGTTPRNNSQAVSQLPKGPAVEKVRAALAQAAECDYVEKPLSDVIHNLKEIYKIEVQLDQSALENAGIMTDTSVSFCIKGVSFGAALQAFEDTRPELHFVVRDYGLLLTTRDEAEDQGYFSAVELARLGNGAPQPMTFTFPSSP